MSLEAEAWKYLPNPENRPYLISSLGRVFNFETRIFLKWYLHKSRCGIYPRYKLGTKKFMAHILVGINFPELVQGELVSVEGKAELDHLDGNTLNPAASNLAWKSNKANIKAFHNSRTIIFNGVEYKAKRKVQNAKKKKSPRRSKRKGIRITNSDGKGAAKSMDGLRAADSLGSNLHLREN